MNRRERRMAAAFKVRRRREPWPWLDALLAYARRNGSRMCEKWDGYPDDPFFITEAGRKVLAAKGKDSHGETTR